MRSGVRESEASTMSSCSNLDKQRQQLINDLAMLIVRSLRQTASESQPNANEIGHKDTKTHPT